MTQEQMRRALSLMSEATKLLHELDNYVLLQRSSDSGHSEKIRVGPPAGAAHPGQYRPYDVEIPEEARRHVFNLWRRSQALKFNNCVRELNQLGVDHDLVLIRLSASDGMPR